MAIMDCSSEGESSSRGGKSSRGCKSSQRDSTLAKGQYLDPRFFAMRDTDGNLTINPRFVDTFLRWECGRYLLGLGLFPNTQEITESMACLEAVNEHLGDLIATTNAKVCAIVIGDGRTPRTGALLAMRTKWTVISVDPALDGLVPSEGADAPTAPARFGMLKELRHPNLAKQEQTAAAQAKRARLRTELASIARLTLLAYRAEETSVRFGTAPATAATIAATAATAAAAATATAAAITPPLPAADAATCHVAPPMEHVLILLPHAHVTPDTALACLCFDGLGSSPNVTISMVALPCCGYVHHGTALEQPPDADFLDARIAASARAVRVWRDVGPRFDFRGSARRRGVPRRVMDLTTSNERKRGGQPIKKGPRGDRGLVSESQNAHAGTPTRGRA